MNKDAAVTAVAGARVKYGSQGGATVYAAAVLAGAALVFQIQPIAGKMLLPSFGGGASVWTACMFFFQAMLLVGYAYTHLLTKFLRPRRQAIVHAALLLLSTVYLPVGVAADPASSPGQDPAWLILLSLLTAIGFPFVMLASTAPLVQRWKSMTSPARSPYRLYALSNAGALLALLSYPVLVEPNISLRTQAALWSVGYGGCVIVLLAAAWHVWRQNPSEERGPDGEKVARGGLAQRLDAVLTVFLSASGVVILLAVTNEITQNVAPVPFLWIAPLVVYLLTYIICFSGERWYDRAVWGSLFVVAASSLVILHFFGTSFPIVPVIASYLLVLFCACMVSHAELYRLRPEAGRLTLWYLLVASGGAIGGAFVSVVAPFSFERYWEGLVGVYLIYVVFGVIVMQESRGVRRRADSSGCASSDLRIAIERWGLRLFALGWFAGLILLPAVVVSLNKLRVEYDVASVRNFYGLLNVRDVTREGVARRILVDGTTIHGFQLLEGETRLLPTSYYGPQTGIAEVMENLERPAWGVRVGIVGLGTGTLAAYGKPGDQFRFYELNPAVVDVANTWFSFLSDSQASVETVLGDGRVSLERELRQHGSREYDVLVIDAFNSDAIPVHLLTLEALELYWSHLKPGGVLALHLTNNYLDLVPVASNLGYRLGKEVTLVTTAVEVGLSSAADWMVLTEPSAGLSGRVTEDAGARELTLPELDRVWTDDYSNLLNTLRRKPK